MKRELTDWAGRRISPPSNEKVKSLNTFNRQEYLDLSAWEVLSK